MTTKNTSRYATTNPNLRQPFSDFGHHNQQATDARMPCGTRTRTFNHSGQLEKFVTLGDCNAPFHQLAKYRHYAQNPKLTGKQTAQACDIMRAIFP
jgi:hypothetical protein